MIKKLFSCFDDFINLVYPGVCAGCGNSLYRQERYICTSCLYNLPKTGFHKEEVNSVSMLFWGRSEITNAAAYCYFHKKGLLQNLIHQLKYKGYKELGFELGFLYGLELVNSAYQAIDIIVPVPLHPLKIKKRGYNQSEWIAKGLSSAMSKPLNVSNLYREGYTETQTRKGRYDRFLNVEKVFQVKKTSLFEKKHVLLVDDIVTTGSTLEACANLLLGIDGVTVSLVTIGFA
ncbi:MAG: ComF family protein [bacterium]